MMIDISNRQTGFVLLSQRAFSWTAIATCALTDAPTSIATTATTAVRTTQPRPVEAVERLVGLRRRRPPVRVARERAAEQLDDDEVEHGVGV